MAGSEPSDWSNLSAPDQNHQSVIAIDGPAASGKSTVAGELAERLGALLFDTGTLYRTVTLAALRARVPVTDGPALAKLADERHIEVTPPSEPDGRLYDVQLDGEDVTWGTRDVAVDANVSDVSAHPEVRRALLGTQRRIAGLGPVVMVGRDIGTEVIPDAGVKIFLDASLIERARRRAAEMQERGVPVDLTAVAADLERRDAIDSGRLASPLRIARDAHVIQTDGLSVDQVVTRIEAIVRHAFSASLSALSRGNGFPVSD